MKKEWHDTEEKKGLTRGFSNWKNRFPILFNLILIFIVALLLIWIILMFLAKWTLHGIEDVIPDVKGKSAVEASAILSSEGMIPEITDSIYDSTLSPGTVVEQNPHPTSRVKPGRIVYLTIVAYSPKMVKIPDLTNMSLRQGVSMLEGLGFKNVIIRRIPSEYKDLILGASVDGRILNPDRRVPVTASVTIDVGQGYVDEEEEIDEL